MRIVNLGRERTCTHYCGRVSSYNARQHGAYMDLGNKFPITPTRPRSGAVAEFEVWVKTQPLMLERIKALPEDAVLGCWCVPDMCHVDIIVKIWKELNHK